MRVRDQIIRKVLAVHFSRFHNKSVQDQRDSQEWTARFTPAPKNLKYQPVSADGVPAEWIVPPGETRGVVLYFHGGAYAVGSINTHRAFISRLVQAAGLRGLAVDYRLAPEHPFPAALEDALKAYRWLLAQNCEPGQILLAGDSAGGGLAAAVLVALREMGSPLPAGAVFISPWTDLANSGETMKTKAEVDFVLNPDSFPTYAAYYAGEQPVKDPLISPFYADLAGLPPFYVLVGSDEILLDDAVGFAANAREAGVKVSLDVWEGMFHVFPMVPVLQDAEEAVGRIAAFARQLLEPHRS